MSSDTESDHSESPLKRRRGASPYDEEELRVLVLCASMRSARLELARGVLGVIMEGEYARERFAALWSRMDRARYFFLGPDLAGGLGGDVCGATLQSMRDECPEGWRGFSIVFFERCTLTGEQSVLSESAIQYIKEIALPLHYVFIDGLSPGITEDVESCRFTVFDDEGDPTLYTLREWLIDYNYEFLDFGVARDALGGAHKVTAARSLL